MKITESRVQMWILIAIVSIWFYNNSQNSKWEDYVKEKDKITTIKNK